MNVLLQQAEVLQDQTFGKRRISSIRTCKKRMDLGENFQKRKLWVEQLIQHNNAYFSSKLRLGLLSDNIAEQADL